MRVFAPQTQQQESKPLLSSSENNGNQGSNTNHDAASCYKPIMALGLGASPAPAPAAEDSGSVAARHLEQWGDHALRSMDWDSIMRDLGLDDDSNKPDAKAGSALSSPPPLTGAVDAHLAPSLPHQLDPNYANLDFDFAHELAEGFGDFDEFAPGFDFVDELVRAADCVDSNDVQVAQAILASLDQQLRSPLGNPLQRSTFYFKEALQRLLASGSNRGANGVSSWPEIVNSIRAHKAFSGISPIPMFGHFTANQAILESLMWKASPPQPLPFVHIVDFDIGFGGRYASLMREIAERTVNVRFLRVTAVVPDDHSSESKLVEENLIQFARDLKIRFQIDFVSFRTFEILSFEAIKFVGGECTAVLLSPSIFRRLNDLIGFAENLRKILPTIVVFVDGEGWTDSTGAAASSSPFRQELVSEMAFYSVFLESLESSPMARGDLVRRIETFVVRPRIWEAVEWAVQRRRACSAWREALFGAGFRPVGPSQFAAFQAEFLLGNMQPGGGFHVARRQAEMSLCWHGKTLVATSVWRRFV